MEMVSTTTASSSSSLLSGVYLVWQELTAVLPNHGRSHPPKKLLNCLSGYASPGRLMAIMGPSGSGKSTLLDSLAGRLGRNVVLSGNVLLNGKKRRVDYGTVAYVTQEDVLLGTLTVREYITYSAQLRFPTSMTETELIAAAEAAIEEMGLQDCADRPIGNWHLRGISGGEKKRLSVALEMLTRPRLLLLDEPTSGLDSAAAFFVTETLRQMAADGDRTVVASVHQPSSEVFALFDDLLLLSGGEAVYFGDAKTATQFFAEVGFPCPSRRNPSDHFLRCINSDFDQVIATLKGSMKSRMERESPLDPLSKSSTSAIKEMLIESYKSSNYARIAKQRIQEILKIEGLTAESDEGSQATWWKQLTTLTRRSFVNMSRDIGYYWLRIVVYIVVSVCVGSIYYDIGTGYTSIMARAACGGFVSGFMTILSIGGFPSFVEELKVFYRERRNGYYGAAVYIVSNFVSSFPFLATTATVTGAIACSMVKDRRGFEHYAYFIASICTGVGVIESLMMIVASLVPNFMMGIITGSGIIGVIMMTSGFFRLLPDLPKVFWRYPVSYINYASWGLQGNLKDAFLGLEFDPMAAGGPKVSGEYVVEHMFGIGLERSKWFDLLAMFAILVAYRIFFFLVLKFKESAAPVLLRTIYTRLVTLRQIDARRRPSTIKKRSTPTSFSSRLPSTSLHPLALQEGLSSPLP